MESRIHGDMYVRFGGRLAETYHRKVEKRCWPSLLKEMGYVCEINTGRKRQGFVDALQEMGYVCEINTPINITYYKGNERIDEVHPKYELMGTHTGRRTFICNALMLGISPEVVMKWTGHSDYNSMKPYIDIADSTKSQAMKLFNKK